MTCRTWWKAMTLPKLWVWLVACMTINMFGAWNFPNSICLKLLLWISMNSSLLVTLLFIVVELDRGLTKKTFDQQYKDEYLVGILATMINYPISKASPTTLLNQLPVYQMSSSEVFPNVDRLRDNWTMIRDEYIHGQIEYASATKPIKHDSLFEEIADMQWKRLYLKWYGPIDSEARQLMPKTCALIESMPEVHLAMISILGPGGKIRGHSGAFRGCLRYHLGLDTPEDDNCFINVGGNPYSWRNGQDVIFDDTYYHYVENNTSKSRCILFLDIERPLTNKIAQSINAFLIQTIGPLTTRANSKLEKVEST